MFGKKTNGEFDTESKGLTGGENSDGRGKKHFNRGKFLKIGVPLAAFAAVVAVAAALLGGGPNSAMASADYTYHSVEKRDVTLTLSGTGSLSPADSYTVTTLISGDILSAPFEEGDVLEKDAILYEVDSSDIASGIEQAELALAQSRRNQSLQAENLSDLSVKAPESGEVLEISVEVGDDVSAGQTIAQIRNSATMSLVIPFGSDDAANFYVGQSAEVTLDGTFERVTGTITKISAVEERLDGNMLVRKVTIEVENPGGIAPGQAATAMAGGIACNGSGSFEYKGESAVTAKASGKVSSINVSEGDVVGKNQVIVNLSSTSLSNSAASSGSSVRESEISLENKYKQLEDYTITSPIAGTVIEKFYKEGDTLESGKTLCTIFDLSYLTMTLNVDELDIAQISVGQKVSVTAEALPGRVFEAYVTKININGVSTNGATSYPVEIRIDETDGLLPGMNVQAEIILSASEDVIAIPVSALQRGNRVLVKTEGAEAPAEGSMIPEGYAYVEVTTGSNDGSFIEITSGLKEGDVVAYIGDTAAAGGAGENMVMVGGPEMAGGPEMNVTYETSGGRGAPSGGAMPGGGF